MDTTPTPTTQAKTEIALAAQEAVKVIANAAAEAVRVANTKGADDHDLLVELKVKMEGLKADIKEINDGTTNRIAHLEAEKLNTKDSYPVLYKEGVDKNLDNHEKRLGGLETSNTKQLVIVSIGSGLVALLVTIMIYHILG